MPKSKSINLLPQEEFDASILGRTLKWAMGSFRIIVIVTEMVVMAAFLSRFWLDAQNADLGDMIKVATARISAQSSFEKNFRGIQQKLDVFKQITSTPTLNSKVNLVATTVPQDITLSSISVIDGSIQVKGAAPSELSVAQFVSNLKAQPLFKKIELNSIGSSEQNLSSITFLININY